MKAAVLEHLKKNSGGYVSGEEIAKTLDISRTAVWKYITKLRTDGYRIEARARLGYRLCGVPDLLVPEEVRAGLATRFCGHHYHYYATVGSTNDRARELARGGAPEGTTVLAEVQTGGRGRFRRTWESPPGGLWFSVLFRPALPPARAPEITFVAAVAGAQALNAELGIRQPDDEGQYPIGIKWPNDFVWRGKKLGGILTELSGELDHINHLVVGVGLNINVDVAGFPAILRHKVTALREIAGRPVSRPELLRQFLAVLEHWYLLWQTDGFGPVLAAWKEYNACLNRPLRLATPEGELDGWAVDVDGGGALLLETGGGIRRIVTGEIVTKDGDLA